MTTRLRRRNVKVSAMTARQLLFAGLGGQERFARLKALHMNARPGRGRWGPYILTADEVFRQSAKDDGFSDEAVAMFIDYVGLGSRR